MNEQPFYIGQRVIAKRTISNIAGIGIVKDNTYVVMDLWQCPICKLWSVDIGLRCEPCGNLICSGALHKSPKKYDHTVLVWSEFLAPITEAYADMTAEIASSVKTTEEKPDVHKIKEPVNN